jgi:hypothetical protein
MQRFIVRLLKVLSFVTNLNILAYATEFDGYYF